MYNSINISETNMYFEILKFKYGNVLFSYENDEIHKKCIDAYKLIDSIYGEGAVVEKPYAPVVYDSKGGESNETVEGIYQVIYALHHPLGLDIHDFYLPAFALKAASEKTKIKINLSDVSKKYANKLARKTGIKFIDGPDGCFFDAKTKSKPVFRQMEEAFNNGDEKISFDSKEVNSASVRHYAWQIGAINDIKCSVSAGNGIITVRFRPMKKEDKMKEDLISFFRKFSSEHSPEGSAQFCADFFRQIVLDEFENEPYNPDDDEHDETQEFIYLSQVDDEFAGQETEVDETENPSWGSYPDRMMNLKKTLLKLEPEYEISETTGYPTEEDSSWGKSSRPEAKTYYNPDADGSNFINDPDFQPNEQGEFWATVDGKRVWMDDMGDYISEAEKLAKDALYEEDDF